MAAEHNCVSRRAAPVFSLSYLDRQTWVALKSVTTTPAMKLHPAYANGNARIAENQLPALRATQRSEAKPEVGKNDEDYDEDRRQDRHDAHDLPRATISYPLPALLPIAPELHAGAGRPCHQLHSYLLCHDKRLLSCPLELKYQSLPSSGYYPMWGFDGIQCQRVNNHGAAPRPAHLPRPAEMKEGR